MLYPPELRARAEKAPLAGPAARGARIIRKGLTERQFSATASLSARPRCAHYPACPLRPPREIPGVGPAAARPPRPRPRAPLFSLHHQPDAGRPKRRVRTIIPRPSGVRARVRFTKELDDLAVEGGNVSGLAAGHELPVRRPLPGRPTGLAFVRSESGFMTPPGNKSASYSPGFALFRSSSTSTSLPHSL